MAPGRALLGSLFLICRDIAGIRVVLPFNNWNLMKQMHFWSLSLSSNLTSKAIRLHALFSLLYDGNCGVMVEHRHLMAVIPVYWCLLVVPTWSLSSWSTRLQELWPWIFLAELELHIDMIWQRWTKCERSWNYESSLVGKMALDICHSRQQLLQDVHCYSVVYIRWLSYRLV